MESYLAVVWGLLLGLAIVMYVILDGFDLGIGILFPTTRIEAERDQMMNTIAPFWETATKHGWFSAVAACSLHFRLPIRS